MAIRTLSICAGIGGLDLGLRIAVPDARTVCYLEREAFCAAVLVEKMQAGELDDAPVWTDLATFDGKPWRDAVDCIIAGLPCQPFSCAGKRKGDADERYIWPDFFRILREVRPSLVFLENVPGITAWFRPIGEELCRLGYEFEAGIFSAAEVGATHRRERFFCLACSESGLPWLKAKQKGRQDSQRGSEDVADTRPIHRRGEQPEGEPRGNRRAGFAGSIPGFPPGPSDRESWARVLEVRPDLAPAVAQSEEQGISNVRRTARNTRQTRERNGRGTEQPGRCGLRQGQQEMPEPPLRGVADGTANRVDRLRALGNAVAPLQAAYAFGVLSSRIYPRRMPAAVSHPRATAT